MNSGLAILTPMRKGVGYNFTKNYFNGKCMTYSDLYKKVMFTNPSLIIGGNDSQFTKFFC